MIEFIKALQKRGLEWLNLYYGQYLGVVYNNTDVENLGKIQVYVPNLIREDPLPIWAKPKGLMRGDNYGIHWIPKNGSFVWVTFEFGNLSRPVWSFGPSQGNTSLPFNGDKVIALTTQGGIRVILDDESDTIKIFTNGGVNITISDNEIAFQHGDEVATEPVLLGELTTTWLKTLITTLQNAMVMTNIGPQPFMVNTQTELSRLNSKIDDLKSTLTKTL